MSRKSERSETTEKDVAFVDVDELRDVNGIVAIISLRKATGGLTFAVFKEFERNGRKERTSFVGEHLLEPYLRMVENVKSRVAELREAGIPQAAGAVASR